MGINLSKTDPDPVHFAEELAPDITSQYDPAGRGVVKVAVQSESALFIATNPSAPEHGSGWLGNRNHAANFWSRDVPLPNAIC